MEPKLRVLHIEDQAADSVIAGDLLARAGFPVELDRVASMEDSRVALDRGTYHLILCDYALPGMDALEILRLARERRPDVPFIFLSGTLGEDVAIECLRLGATDYVLKHNLAKLAPAVRRALAEAEEHARRQRAEAELRKANEAQARLAAIVESSQDPILSTTLEGIVTTWNPAAERLFGYAAAEVIGKPNPIVPPDRQKDEALFNERLRVGGLVRQFETTRLTKDGRRLEVQITLSPLRDPSGQIVGSSRIIHDITHRRGAEAAIREHQERLTFTTLAAQLGTWDWNVLSDELVWSPRCLELFALPADTRMTYQRFLGAVHPEDRERIDRAVRGALERHEHYDVEIRVPWPDGSTHWVASRGRAYYDRAGRPTRMSGIALDITARKRAEEELHLAVQRFETLANMMPQIVWSTRPDGYHDYFNERWYEFTGMPRGQEGLGFSWTNYLHPDDIAPTLEAWHRSLATGESYEVQYRFRRASDGVYKWFIGRAEPIRDREGDITRWFGTCTEITELLEIQQSLRQSEERQRLLAEELGAVMDAAPAGVMVAHDPECHLITGNGPAHEMLGVPLQESISASPSPQKLSVFFRVYRQGREADPAELPMQVAAATGTVVRDDELEVHRSDGSRRTLLVTAAPLYSAVGSVRGSVGVATDITERKVAEDQLKRQALHLQLFHQAAARLLVGQQPVELLRQLHPQIAQVFGADAFMLYQADPGNGQLHLLACAGVSEEQKQRLETLRYGRAVCVRPEEALQPIIATQLQTTQATNRRFVRKLGFRCYLYYPLILNNHIHGTVAFASRTRDDYDQMDLDFFHTIASTLAEALERERLENELQRHATGLEKTVQERTAKLRETIAELEQMSYSMIHDLRAPLRAIQSFGGIVVQDPENRLTEESRKLIRQMGTAADRMDHLVRDVLNYGRVVREELPLGPVDVGALAHGIVETYPEVRSSGAQVEIAPGLPLVRANPAALTQCLAQLFENAIKFAKPGITPQLRLWAEEKANGWIRLMVQDNGVGIAPELQVKVFGMFQQLRNTGQGTGMGLAIVKKAAERMGGHVGVESEPGRGSRFWIELKAAAQPTHEPVHFHSE